MDWVLSGGFCYGDGEEVFMWDTRRGCGCWDLDASLSTIDRDFHMEVWKFGFSYGLHSRLRP